MPVQTKNYIYAHMHAHSMVKVISLSEKAYISLKSIKGEDESFSDVVTKLTTEKKRTNILELFGKWPGSKEELNRIEKELHEDRKKFKLKEVEF